LLAAYFVAHAVRHLTTEPCGAGAAPVAPGGAAVLERRAVLVPTARGEAVAHVAMGAAMAVMLLGTAA
ncbi:MAG TPA: hypothetical protein VM367_11670, partial [Pseudonocardia sp.]|nr:hypothetical protein [Pseudonocardia sp.]